MKKRCWYSTATNGKVKKRGFNILLTDISGMDDLAFTVRKIPEKIVMGVLAQDFKCRWPQY
jgi:hypothetical protein